MRLLSTIFILGFCLFVEAQETTYFENKVEYTKTGNMTLSKVITVMPIPQTNEYQTIDNLMCSSGEIIRAKGNSLLFSELKNFSSNQFEVKEQFKITTKPIKIDFNNKANPNVCESSKSPDDFLWEDGVYINLSSPKIKEIGDKLWKESIDEIDYARKCYEYVATNFKYINGSWRTLDEILSIGGGECGDFTTVTVNLLRYKGIPARHNITLLLNGGYHVWPDFYHKDYGWIPVDPTYKNSNRSGDYFGRYGGGAVIVSQDLIQVKGLPVVVGIGPLQTYIYWYWYSSGSGNISSVHKFSRIEAFTDAIFDVNDSFQETKAYYDLTGRKIKSIDKSGIYIKNGRKIFVR